MRSRLLRRVAIIVLVVCITTALFLVPTGCGEVENKAIIILPGIMGSNIIDAKTGDPLWAPLPPDLKMFELDIEKDISTIIKTPAVQKLIDFDGPGGAYEWLDKMMIDPKGRSKNKNTAQVIDDDGNVVYDRCAPYGTLNYYEKTFHYLDDKFGDEYDVRMFEYDWRLDNSVNAKKLDEFIKSHNYTDVTIIGHSMGGVLGATYLASISEEDRQVINKFIPLGAPFFGAHKAVRVMDDPLSMAEGMEDVLETVKKAVDAVNGNGAFDKFITKLLYFVHNLPTVYQLMPYEDMCPAYDENSAYAQKYPEMKDMGIITIDGKPIKKYEDVLAFFNDKDYINHRCLDKTIAWQREQYVKQGDKWIHASALVDTRYVVGVNLPTELCVDFDKNGKLIGSKTPNRGDGTVPDYSASCGLALDDPKVKTFDGISHGDLSYDDRCLDYIAELIMEK